MAEEVQTETETVETTETTETETVEEVETTETPEEVVETQETEEVKQPETEEVEETTDQIETEETEEVEEEQEEAEEADSEVDSLKVKLKAGQKKMESLKAQNKEYETLVSSIVDAKVKDIPKEFQALVPEGSLASKLAWITKAEESGLFKKQSTPDVEIGKPLTLGNKNQKAKSENTPQQKLSNYFSNRFSK